MAATSGSKGRLITLPSFNNVASSDRQNSTCILDGHGKLRHALRVVASRDTAPSPAVAQRRDAPAATWGETEECRIVIRNTCW